MRLGKFKLGLVVVATLGLTACFGGSSSNNSKSNEVSLNDLVGVWDETQIIDGETDVYYSVINTYGAVINYDYQNDSFDQGEDCYNKFEDAVISALGNSMFIVRYFYDPDFFSQVKLSINGNTLLSEIVDSSFSENIGLTFTSVRSDLSESDFVPLCD